EPFAQRQAPAAATSSATPRPPLVHQPAAAVRRPVRTAPQRANRTRPGPCPGTRADPRPNPVWSLTFPTLAQPLEGPREQCRAVLVGPAFLDVGEMRLVGLGALLLRRVVLVPARGQSAARAFPLVRDFRVDGEERPRFVLVGTPIRHRNPRNRF